MATNKGWANIRKEVRGDEVLVEVTGLASGTRAQYVRGVWQYIKTNNLQMPHDGRRVIPDATLARLMGIQGQPMNAFTMLRYIERHLQTEEGNQAEDNQPEANHEEANHEEANHEEANHEEANHEEANHEEANHEEANHEEGNQAE